LITFHAQRLTDVSHSDRERQITKPTNNALEVSNDPNAHSNTLSRVRTVEFGSLKPTLHILIVSSLLTFNTSSLKAEDWPQWQGPNRDAVSAESGLLGQWPEGGPPLAWRAEGLGGGDSAPAIAGGTIYGMSNQNEKEIVWAINENDGSPIWKAVIGDRVEQRMSQSKEGPGGTPTVEGDRIYVIGMGGVVACLDRIDGKLIWKRQLAEEFGGIVPPWSFRESPLVDENRVICTPGGPEAMMLALNKSNGKTVWKTVPKAQQSSPSATDRSGGGGRPGRRGPRSGAAYSSAIAIDFEGERQYVQLTAKALIGVSANQGDVLWQYTAPANAMGINCSTPIYKDGILFAASAYGNGGGAIKLIKKEDGSIDYEELYFSPSMQNHHGGMVVIDGALYGANGGNGGGMMACLDYETGKVLWRERKGPKGALMYADGRIYLRSELGPIVLMEPSKEEYIERGRFEQPDRSGSRAWAHPVVANGKLYIRDQGLLLCYDVQAK
jgi:outer membrane protein assembly factor BamB